MAKGADTFRALRHRDFRLYLGGMSVSLAGTWMQNLAQAWLVYRLTESEWMLGLTWFCANVPVLLLSPLAGAVADRWPRRRIVMIAQATAMGQAATLAALTLTGRVEMWHVLALAGMLGVVTAFDIPARQALFIRLVGKEDLLNAISLNSAMFNAARVVGPSLGGLIVARAGEGVCFLLNAVTYLAVLPSLAAMRVREDEGGASSEAAWRRVRHGVSYAWRTPEIQSILLLCAAIALGTAPGSTLAPVFAEGIFHRGSQGLGLLTSAMGLGAILGTLSLARRRSGAGLPRVIVTSALILSAALAVFAWSPDYWLSLAMMPLIGMAVMRHNASTNTALQMITPEDYRGRVMGLYSMTVIGFIPIGSLLAGALAARIGSRWTVSLGAVACVLAALHARRHSSRWDRRLADPAQPAGSP